MKYYFSSWIYFFVLFKHICISIIEDYPCINVHLKWSELNCGLTHPCLSSEEDAEIFNQFFLHCKFHTLPRTRWEAAGIPIPFPPSLLLTKPPSLFQPKPPSSLSHQKSVLLLTLFDHAPAFSRSSLNTFYQNTLSFSHSDKLAPSSFSPKILSLYYVCAQN